MSVTLPGLLHTVEDERTRAVQFFNGRLLSAADLTHEQESGRERLRRLGRALGPGVLEGLELTWGGSTAPQTLRLSAGAAITAEGELLTLGGDQELPWAKVREALSAPAKRALGAFGPCTATTTDEEREGHLFALLAFPTTEAHGRAPGAAVLRSAAGCGVDHVRDAIALVLRYLPLPGTLKGEDLSSLRSRLAYALLEPGAQDRWQPTWTEGADEPEPVPLALLWAKSTSIQWLDMWSVRRLASPAAASTLADLVGACAPARGLARLMQQREHLRDLPEGSRDDELRWLAPGGLLPGSDLSLIRPWLTGERTELPEPAFQTVPAGLILETLRRTLGLAALERPDPTTGDPRPALDLLRWEGVSAWAQSDRAQLEVRFSPADIDAAAWADTEIILSAPNGASWRQTGAERQRVFLFTDLPGGAGFTLVVSNPALQPMKARAIELVVGSVLLEHYDVEALPSAAPDRWIDIERTAGNKERWYLAVAYAGDAMASTQSTSSGSSGSRTVSGVVRKRTSGIGASSGIRNATEMFSLDTGNYTTRTDVPAALQAWLVLWKRQLASLCDDPVQAAAILRSTPKVLWRKRTSGSTVLTRDENTGEVSRSSEGAEWKVQFGSLSLPFRVVDADLMSPMPVPLESNWMAFVHDSYISALAGIGLEYIDELFGATEAELSEVLPNERMRDALRRFAKGVIDQIKKLLDQDEDSLSDSDRLSVQMLKGG